MKKLVLSITFIIMILAQWFVPGNMIFGKERTLKKGVAYKFKTTPIDPTDPFRGKYIILNYEMERFETTDLDLPYDTDIYVYIKNDSLGFAQPVTLSETPLDIEEDYVIAKSGGYYNGVQSFNLPFTTYYMEESKAYDAEVAVRKVQRDTSGRVCYAVVHVLGDDAVVADVKIDDISIKDFVKK